MRRREALGVLGGVALGSALTGGRVAGEAASYTPLGSVTIDGAKEAVVGPDRKTAYVAATDGFAVADVAEPAEPTVRYETRDVLGDRDGGPLGDIWDVKVDGDRLLVVGPAHGLGFQAAVLYDVRDPDAPERVAVYEPSFPIHNAALVDERAYLTGNDGDANPVVIVDMGADPPVELGRWSPIDHEERWGEIPHRVRPIHDLQVSDGLAYLNYWDLGTWAVDVADPAAPAFVSRLGGRSHAALRAETAPVAEQITALPGNHHSCAVNEDGTILAIGKEAFATGEERSAGGPGGIDLWDVSTPASPSRLTTIAPPPTPDPTRRGTWTTAHNFDLHGGRLYSAWYQGGVKIHALDDPAAPRELAWWRDPSGAAFWTAQHAASGVIASDAGDGRFGGDGKSRLYVFPDRAGEQPDPPSLTPTATPTDAATAREPRAGPSESTATTVRGRQAGSTEPRTVEAPAQPGFGIAAGLLGLSSMAWRWLRNSR